MLRSPVSVLVVLSIAMLIALSARIVPLAAAQARKSVSDGVYASAQAARGKTTFDSTCSGCHGGDLSGGSAPDLNGTRFMNKWDFQTVNQLFTEIKTRMPRNNPGTLTDDAYLDVVTYILQANGFPAGDGELKAEPETLGTILIQKKPGQQPTELPTGTLALLVGCLAQGAGNTWVVTNASAPARTDNPDASKGDQRKVVEAMPLGNQTFELINVFSSLDSHKGRKMEVKGFLVRTPEGDRVNVVTLEMLSSSCGQ
jgi:mono/diheme cytochrome c family protein